MSEFKVDVKSGKSFQVEKLGENSMKIDGKEFPWDCIQLSEGQYHLIHQNQSFQLEIVEADYASKSFQIKVNNKIISLEAEDRFDLLLHQLGMDSIANAGVSELKAPMPGLVLEIPVSVGQTVQKDEPLAVLEAMKMENVLKSPAELVVKAISVEKGQAVEKNQVLIEFEN